jgi:hypothetical protein
VVRQDCEQGIARDAPLRLWASRDDPLGVDG